MKTRRWIIFIALFVGFTALVIYHGWYLINANEKLKNYLLAKTRPVLNEKFNIQELDVSIGAVHLKDVDVQFNNNYYSLHIEDIRLGFNFINLIKSGFRLREIPQDVIFVKPHLSIRKSYQKTSQKSGVDSTLKEIKTEKYLKTIENFKFIKRITIADGKISYIDSTNDPILLGKDINGWLSTGNMEYAQARLVGKIFNSENYNLNITGKMDLIRGRFDLVDINVKNYQWNQKDSFFLPDYYNINQGKINGQISLTEKKGNIPGFNISGEISIQDGAVALVEKNLNFEQINLNAKIKKWNCLVDSSTMQFNGSPVAISGAIYNILNPRLNLELRSLNFDLKKFSEYFDKKNQFSIQGQSNIICNLSNTFDNPTFIADFQSDKIAIQQMTFHRTNADLQFKNKRFHVKNLNTNLDGIHFESFCQIDFNNQAPKLLLTLKGRGNPFETLIKPPLKSLHDNLTNIEINAGGDINALDGEININTKILADQESDFVFQGNLKYAKNQLFVQLNELNRSFSMTSQINLFSADKGSYLNLIGLHNLIHPFNEFNKYKKIIDLKKSVLNIEMRNSSFFTKGSVHWNKKNGQLDRKADFTCTIDNERNKDHIYGDINLMSAGMSFDGVFDVLRTPDKLIIKKLDINDFFQSHGTVNYLKNNQVEAHVLLENMPLKNLSSLAFRDSMSFEQGQLNGNFDLGGTFDNLSAQGRIKLYDCIIHGVGEYGGDIAFNLANRKFVLNTLQITKNQQPILESKGYSDLTSDEINFELQGNNFELNETLTAIFNKSGILSGTGRTDLQLTGKTTNPIIKGNLNIQQGKLSRFAFDEMLLEFGIDQQNVLRNSLQSGLLLEDGIILSQIHMLRKNQFEVRGGGFIPYSNEESLDVKLFGEGNVLSILPELDSFFKITKSTAQWDIHFTGSPKNLSVAEGKIDLTEGYLNLKAVAPKIKDITIKVNLEQDGFLNVEYISGKIRGKPFTFKNQRQLKENKKLVPFAIDELGLNFGVFTLETSADGIPLHIPGLMKKGEFGNFAFKGKSEDEKFYIAGPPNKPYIRGKISLDNVNFTFPFISNNSGQQKTNPVVEVLKTIEWDVSTKVGKDLHYQRQIPSGLDNVYVDLILDSGIGGLNFEGILNEDSFGVTGLLESSRGNVEYLNLNFQVLKAGAEFDMDVSQNAAVEFDKSSLRPIIYGEARTTVTDSTGFPYYIYLTLLTEDEETGVAQKRGRLGQVSFQLSSENATLGDSEGEILASLGYSVSNIKGMATDIIGISTDNLVFRPLFRPFERQLEQSLGLDMVRFSSRFTRNLIEMNVSEERNFVLDSKLFLLRSTKVMIGKYLADQLFLMYSGQLEAGMDYRYQHEGFGLNHKFGLEYRINQNLLLQMEYDYNSLLLGQREDKRILLRHSFPF